LYKESFRVYSSNGEFLVSLKGEILQLTQFPNAANMSSILHFDTKEYQQTYGEKPKAGDSVDILDLGYTVFEKGEKLYIPPAENWRKQCKPLQATHSVIL